MLTKILTNPVLLIAMGLLLAAVFARVIVLFARKPGNGPLPAYTSNEFLLSAAERSFLGVAVGCLGDGWVITPKVRLADLLSPPPGLPRSQFQHAFNRIAAKHVDFTICRAADYAIAGVVELDDQSHQRASRASRDVFVNEALAAAGIPILHVKAQSRYEARELSAQLKALAHAPPATARNPQSATRN